MVGTYAAADDDVDDGDDDNDVDEVDVVDIVVTFAGCSLMHNGSVWLAEGGAGLNLL